MAAAHPREHRVMVAPAPATYMSIVISVRTVINNYDNNKHLFISFGSLSKAVAIQGMPCSLYTSRCLGKQRERRSISEDTWRVLEAMFFFFLKAGCDGCVGRHPSVRMSLCRFLTARS